MKPTNSTTRARPGCPRPIRNQQHLIYIHNHFRKRSKSGSAGRTHVGRTCRDGRAQHADRGAAASQASARWCCSGRKDPTSPPSRWPDPREAASLVRAWSSAHCSACILHCAWLVRCAQPEWVAALHHDNAARLRLSQPPPPDSTGEPVVYARSLIFLTTYWQAWICRCRQLLTCRFLRPPRLLSEATRACTIGSWCGSLCRLWRCEWSDFGTACCSGVRT